MSEETEDFEQLQRMLAEANKTIREQERKLSKYGRLLAAAREILKWAEWGGVGYSIGPQPVNDLRAAVQRLES